MGGQSQHSTCGAACCTEFSQALYEQTISPVGVSFPHLSQLNAVSSKVCEGEAPFITPSQRLWQVHVNASAFSARSETPGCFLQDPAESRAAILWGGCRGSPCRSLGCPQITFKSWWFIRLALFHYATVACGDERASLLWATAGDWRLPCPVSPQRTWEVPGGKPETLRSNPKSNYLETLARCLDTGLTGGWGVRGR